MKPFFLVTSIILIFGTNTMLFAQNASPTYQAEIDTWHQHRIERLKAPGGWLNLTGLFWLKPGKNFFGSAETNQLVYVHKDMPAVAGYFDMDEKLQVTWHSSEGVKVTIKSNPIVNQIIFTPDSADAAPLLELGSLRWNVIKREERMGIRLRDLESSLLKTFQGIERYAVDSAWRFTANLIPAEQEKVPIKNVIGQTTEEKTAGKLTFSYHGELVQLEALDEGQDLFIIFSDATNGQGTYPSGRFLYAKRTADGKNIIVDFNKAYNPPCSFTDFATCPLPPPQNRLQIPITAGEKSEGHH